MTWRPSARVRTGAIIDRLAPRGVHFAVALPAGSVVMTAEAGTGRMAVFRKTVAIDA
jgi:hypothetical protein